MYILHALTTLICFVSDTESINLISCLIKTNKIIVIFNHIYMIIIFYISYILYIAFLIVYINYKSFECVVSSSNMSEVGIEMMSM